MIGKRTGGLSIRLMDSGCVGTDRAGWFRHLLPIYTDKVESGAVWCCLLPVLWHVPWQGWLCGTRYYFTDITSKDGTPECPIAAGHSR